MDIFHESPFRESFTVEWTETNDICKAFIHTFTAYIPKELWVRSQSTKLPRPYISLGRPKTHCKFPSSQHTQHTRTYPVHFLSSWKPGSKHIAFRVMHPEHAGNDDDISWYAGIHTRQRLNGQATRFKPKTNHYGFAVANTLQFAVERCC